MADKKLEFYNSVLNLFIYKNKNLKKVEKLFLVT